MEETVHPDPERSREQACPPGVGDPDIDLLADIDLPPGVDRFGPGGEQFEWDITDAGPDSPPLLRIDTTGGVAWIELSRTTITELQAGLRAADAANRARLRGHPLPPANDPAARLRSRFDPTRARDWWADPANATARAALLIAAAIVLALIVLGSR